MTLVLSVPEAHSALVNEEITLKSVSIFGVGHLGSNIAYILAKIGVPELNLYDFDDVQPRNISGGPFLESQVEMKKVDAMKKILDEGNIEPKLIEVFDMKVKKDSKIVDTHYYILAVDSIEARIAIFKAISNKKGHLIDIRSRSLLGMVYSFSLSDEIAKIWYLKSMEAQLKDPTEPVHCNESNIIHNSFLISSVATNLFLATLDGNTELKGYKIDTKELVILELPMNYSELKKKYNSKVKMKCKYCGKLHRTSAAQNKCRMTNSSTKKQEKKKKVASRDQFL